MPLEPVPSDIPENPPTTDSRRPQLEDFELSTPELPGNRRKRRTRHAGGRAEHSFWQFGAGIIPPMALIGLTMAILGMIRKDFIDAPVMKAGIAAICGLIVLGLGTILYGITPGSRRLQRKEVWVAIILGIVTLLAFAALFLKDRILRLL